MGRTITHNKEKHMSETNPLSREMLTAIEAIIPLEDEQELAGILAIIASKLEAKNLPASAEAINEVIWVLDPEAK